jgi:site-specific DNA recombinase
MAFEKFATGLYTKQQVLEMVTAAGLRTRKNKKLANQEMDRILANPIYSGWIKIHRWSERKKGNFEPIVGQDLFDRVQAILTGRKPKMAPFQRHHPDFPLRGFIHCSKCGEVITGSWAKGRNKKYPYYHCTGRCRGFILRKEKLEAKFTELLERMQIRQEYVDLFRQIVLDQWEKQNDATIDMLAACQREIKQLGEQKEKLIDAFVYAKAISRETYNERLDKLEEEIALAKMWLHDAQLDEVDLESVLSFAEKFLLDPARLWLEMSLEQRQRFQLVLFPKGIELMPNGEVGTAVTCSVFKMLQPKPEGKTQVAAPTGIEPVFPD